MLCQPGFAEKEYNVVMGDVIAEGQVLLKGKQKCFFLHFSTCWINPRVAQRCRCPTRALFLSRFSEASGRQRAGGGRARLYVCVKERRGRELSVRVAIAGGVYRGGEQLSVGGMCFEGSRCEIFGGLNHRSRTRMRPTLRSIALIKPARIHTVNQCHRSRQTSTNHIPPGSENRAPADLHFCCGCKLGRHYNICASCLIAAV